LLRSRSDSADIVIRCEAVGKRSTSESKANGLVASYDVHSIDGLSALEQDDHQHQPHFIVTGG
jgi:hypothetical protein